MLSYFKDHINKYCSSEYNPRHFGSFHYKFTGDTSIEYLNGKWAVPGKTYSQSIAKLANQIFVSAPMVGNVENISQRIKDFLNITGQKNWQYIAIHHTVSDPYTTTM